MSIAKNNIPSPGDIMNDVNFANEERNEFMKMKKQLDKCYNEIDELNLKITRYEAIIDKFLE